MESSGQHGGKRLGSGRRRSNEYLMARGISPVTAAEVMAWHGERRAWHRLLNSPDDRVFMQTWLYLLSMRDGKPAQRISVTSTNVNINASDVERAREIAAEFRKAFAASADESPKLGAGEENESIMLPSAEGGKKDGEDGSGL